ncbi:GTP-binding protein [Cupriavidus lacunae]|uniref:CobW/HypB/UreG nucleotide-binding domain-containing protein n=1 Tax=Cupriavidus lacunae TaxID=2666307 RepID=A0A370NMD6_9BURK|nr:GTP-binding protein [Cupriavidus lacunae]RDK06751.1 hypothetical protein DN412_29635 [Cupriavidus lacunae]
MPFGLRGKEGTSGNGLWLLPPAELASIGGNFSQALLRVMALRDPPDRIIIEASGVSDPWKIAQVGLTGHRLRLDSVIVLADATSVRQQARDRYIGDVLPSQLCAADLLLLNKTDLIDEHQRSEVARVAGHGGTASAQQRHRERGRLHEHPSFATSCLRRLVCNSPLEEEENIAPSAFRNGADVDPLNACQAALEPEVPEDLQWAGLDDPGKTWA